MTFAEFIAAYNDYSIRNDATWRAYNIEIMQNERYAKKALKRLGYEPTVLGFGQARADWGIETVARAKYLLGMWYVYATVSSGRQIRNLVRRQGHEKS